MSECTAPDTFIIADLNENRCTTLTDMFARPILIFREIRNRSRRGFNLEIADIASLLDKTLLRERSINYVVNRLLKNISFDVSRISIYLLLMRSIVCVISIYSSVRVKLINSNMIFK